MELRELRNKLEEEGVPENMYSLLVGGFPNEAFCLIEIDNGWEVYFSERGKKRGIKQYSNESEACDYMYKKLSKYATKQINLQKRLLKKQRNCTF